MLLNHPLQNLLEPVVEGLGYELVRILTIGAKNQTLQVMIDTKNGTEITVDDCASVSRALSDVLDEKDPIENQYSLEVSSPGIDRPLTKLQHFQRFLGYEIKAETLVPVESRKRFKGIISTKEKIERHIKECKCNVDEKEYFEAYKNAKTGYYQDTVDIIKELKKDGNRVYLLSNLAEIDYKIFKEQFDMSLFDGLFLSYEMHKVKPEKEIFEEVINKLGKNPNDIIFLDDREKNVKMARECGIDAYLVTGDSIKECSVWKK